MKRLTALLLGLVSVFAFAGHAAAEGTNTVESSNPSSGESVDVAPTQIQLKFAEPIGGTTGLAKVVLALSCNGKLVGLGQPQLGADDTTISAPLTALPGTGTCNVSWSLGDGSAGSFTFTNNAAQPTTTVPGQVTTPTTVPGTSSLVVTTKPRLGGPVGLARLLSFLFISAIVGGLVMIALVWPEGAEYGITERYMRLMAIAAVLSMTLLIVLSTAQRTGNGVIASLNPTEWFELLGISTGRGIFLRFFLVLGAAFWAWIPERISDPATRPQTIATLGLLTMTFGFDRVGGDMFVLGAIANIIHMALVMAWVGGAMLLARVVLAGPGEEDLLQALRGWCRLATPMMLGLAATGVFQVWRLDGLSLINSGHGRLVLFKSALVFVLVIIEGAMREFVLKRMSREKVLRERAVFTLRRSASMQMMVSIIVLGASSWLMSMRPPNVLPESTGPKITYAVNQELKGEDGFHVAIHITPATPGPNEMLVELFAPSRIQHFTVRLIPSDPTVPGYEIKVPINRKGAALLGIDKNMLLTSLGQWRIEVSGTTTTGELKTLTSTFTISTGAPGTTTTSVDPNAASTTTTTTVAPGTTTTTLVSAQSTTTVAG